LYASKVGRDDVEHVARSTPARLRLRVWPWQSSLGRGHAGDRPAVRPWVAGSVRRARV